MDRDIKQNVHAAHAEAEALFAALAASGPGRVGITRDTYGAGENAAHALIARHAAQRGLRVTVDFAGNTHMVWPGSDPASPRIAMGSHLDSVPEGGNFDGAAGVLAGLIAVDTLQRLGVRPARDVLVLAIRAEESVWFETSYIGSRSALGVLAPGALEQRRIDTGRTLRSHMAASGAEVEAVAAGRRSIDPATLAAFVELHIEQAPSLVDAGIPVAIGLTIPGNFRFPQAEIIGRHDHVGTPRRFRRDAAIAAADLAMRLDALWAAHDARGTEMAITLGRFHTDAAAHGMTTVPGRFLFSLDVRAHAEDVLADLEGAFRDIVRDVERERDVTIALGERAGAAVGQLSEEIRAGLFRAAGRLGIPARPLRSPASHDAAAFTAAGVPSGMIFVRNANGSHNPHEAMEIADFLDGTAVLAAWLREAVAPIVEG